MPGFIVFQQISLISGISLVILFLSVSLSLCPLFFLPPTQYMVWCIIVNVYVCTCAHVCRSQGRTIGYLSVSLLLPCEKISHWTRNLPFLLGWLITELSGSTYLCLPRAQCWNYRNTYPCLASYLGSGEFIFGSYAFKTSALIYEAIPNHHILSFKLLIVTA